MIDIKLTIEKLRKDGRLDSSEAAQEAIEELSKYAKSIEEFSELAANADSEIRMILSAHNGQLAKSFGIDMPDRISAYLFSMDCKDKIEDLIEEIKTLAQASPSANSQTPHPVTP